MPVQETNSTDDRMLRFSTIFLKILMVANLLCAPLFAGVLILTIINPSLVTETLTKEYGAAAAPSLLILVRFTMLVGLAIVVPVHLMLTRLVAIINSIASIAVFTRDNVHKLRVIAWALLTTQLLDLGYGVASLSLSHSNSTMFDWQPSVTAWLCVLMLFILARVFEHGVALEDDLDGTI